MREEAGSPSAIAICVFNGLLSFTAIILNSVTIHALTKTSSLPNPLRTLLLNLTVSDLGVGLLVQPLFIVLLSMEMGQNTVNNRTLNVMFASLINLFYYASFFGIVALSADRFLAIHLHLRYQDVTPRRVVAVVISVWVLSALISLIGPWIPHFVGYLFVSTVEAICLITTTLFYIKIYLAVRRHTNQIQALQVQQEAQNCEIANAARLRKSATGTFYVYLVFLVCYLPGICINIADISTGFQSTLLLNFQHYALTLVFLNSSLNPVIYCWKMRQIRHSIMGMFLTNT